MRNTARIISTIAIALVVLLMFVPSAGAQSADPVGMANLKTGDTLTTSIYGADSPTAARSLVAQTDDAFVERTMDGMTVIQSESVKPIKGSSATKMFGVLTGDGTPGILVIVSAGSNVYLFLETGLQIESDDIVTFIERTIKTGKIGTPPTGFIVLNLQ